MSTKQLAKILSTTATNTTKPKMTPAERAAMVQKAVDDKKAAKAAKKAQSQAAETPALPTVDGGATVQTAPVLPEVKMTKSGAQPLPLTTALKLVVTENPKKVNSASWHRYEAYRGAKTIGDAMARGATRADIRWDSARGHIVLG